MIIRLVTSIALAFTAVTIGLLAIKVINWIIDGHWLEYGIGVAIWAIILYVGDLVTEASKSE